MKEILAAVIAALFIGVVTTQSHAGTLYESATLGPPDASAGTAVAPDQYLGSSFTLHSAAHVTAIGGHIFSETTLFTAIVPLSSPDDYPDGDWFTDEPFLMSITFEEVQAMSLVAGMLESTSGATLDARVAVDILLQPGDYAIIIGDLYSGTNFMPHAGQQLLPGASTFSCGAFSNCSPSGPTRFVVEGTVVPVPPAILLFGSSLLAGFGVTRATSRRQARNT